MTVTKDTIIIDILQNAGMHCLGCMAAHGETVEQACQVHGLDPETLVSQLNDYFAKQ